MIIQTILIATALLFHHGVHCNKENVDVCKNITGNLSFSGLHNRTKTYMMDTNVCTVTDESFLLLQLPGIATGLCKQSLTISSYLPKESILKYKKNYCFLMTLKKFNLDLFDADLFNCRDFAWAPNEQLFPTSVRFDNLGSDDKCRFVLNYTYISKSEPALTKECCTTSEPSATQGHNDDGVSDYWAGIAFHSILLTLQLAAFVPLWAREFEFNHPEIFRRQQREALPNREE